VRWFRAPAEPPPSWYEPAFHDAAWEQSPQSLSAGPEAIYSRQRFDIGASAPALTDIALVFPGETSLPQVFLNGVALRPSEDDERAERFGFRLPPGTLKDADNLLALRFAPGASPVLPRVEALPPLGDPLLISRGPYLLAPGLDEVTVSFDTNAPCKGEVEAAGRVVTEEGESSSHRLVLRELSPGTRYPYEVRCARRQERVSAQGVATSAPESTGSASVAIFVHGGGSLADLSPRAAALSPDVAVFLGEALPKNADEHAWDDFFRVNYSLLRSTPAVPVLSARRLPLLGLARAAEIFALPESGAGPGRAYALRYGALRLLLLDADSVENDEVRAWMKERAEAAQTEGARVVLVLAKWDAGRRQVGARLDKWLRGLPLDLVVLSGAGDFARGETPGGLSFAIVGSDAPGFGWLSASPRGLSLSFLPLVGEAR
jgi:hypothetical protein